MGPLEALKSVTGGEGWGIEDGSACWLVWTGDSLLLLWCGAGWTAAVWASSCLSLFILVRSERGPARSLPRGSGGLGDSSH